MQKSSEHACSIAGARCTWCLAPSLPAENKVVCARRVPKNYDGDGDLMASCHIFITHPVGMDLGALDTVSFLFEALLDQDSQPEVQPAAASLAY